MTGIDKPEVGDRAVADDLGGRPSPNENVRQNVSGQQEYDQQIAVLFQNMRRSSRQSLDSLAQQLGTETTILEALEKGDLGRLPDWGQSSKVINSYAKLLGISSEPILRRLALNIQARNQQNGQGKEAIVDQEKPGNQAMPPSNPPPSNPASEDISKQPVVIVPAKEPIYRPVDLPLQPKSSTDTPVITAIPAAQTPSLSIEKGAVLPIEEQPKVSAAKTGVSYDADPQRVEPTFFGTQDDTGDSLNNTDSVQPGNRDSAARPPTPVPPEPLRADRRENFGEDRGIAAPHMSPFEAGKKAGIGLLTWLVILISLLAAGYIVWVFSSQPKMAELLLEQLPFISKSLGGL